MRGERNRFPLHTIMPHPSGKKGRFQTTAGNPFDAELYSLYKYGALDIARQYGHNLADAFALAHPEIIFGEGEEILVTSSAFRHSPTASQDVAESFADEINYLRHLQGLPPTDKIKITRTHIIEGDFGTQTRAERLATLANEPFYYPDALMKGKHLIVIDDVIITGVNEDHIAESTKTLGLKSLWFLYVVQMDPEAARANPALENDMNHAAVHDLHSLEALIIRRDFNRISQRLCKSILRHQDPEELRAFLERRSSEFLYSLFRSALGDDVAAMESFHAPFALLESVLQERGLIRNGRLQPPTTY